MRSFKPKKTLFPLFSPSSGYTDHPLTSMRAVIAKRLCQSKSTSPHGYATLECNVDNLNKIRADFANAGEFRTSRDLL